MACWAMGCRVSINPDQLDLFGIRSIDPLEKDLVRDRRILRRRTCARSMSSESASYPAGHRQGEGPRRRACMSPRCDFLRSGGWHPASAHGARRRHLSRGASRDGAGCTFGLVRSVDIVSSIRSSTNAAHRAGRGRIDRQPVRPADQPIADASNAVFRIIREKGGVNSRPGERQGRRNCYHSARASLPVPRRGPRRRPGLRTWQSSSGTSRPVNALSCGTRPCRPRSDRDRDVRLDAGSESAPRSRNIVGAEIGIAQRAVQRRSPERPVALIGIARPVPYLPPVQPVLTNQQSTSCFAMRSRRQIAVHGRVAR